MSSAIWLAIWIAIALVCFVLPATELTRGGQQRPEVAKLHAHANSVGLPLPDYVATDVAERIRRRQRGMAIGGVTGIVVATVSYIIFFSQDDEVAPILVFFLAGAGTAWGGAWAIAAHRPETVAQRPVVARVRSVQLSDYLTPGERFGFWAVPAVVVIGALTGAVLLSQLPTVAVSSVGLAGGVAVAAALTWVICLFATRKVLAAPARSGSELELAWDDAERAHGLRQVVNLTVVVGSTSLLLWLSGIADAVTVDGFYRDHEVFSWWVAGISLLVFAGLAAVTAVGPMAAWITGRRNGYEQRQLWPNGVTA